MFEVVLLILLLVLFAVGRGTGNRIDRLEKEVAKLSEQLQLLRQSPDAVQASTIQSATGEDVAAIPTPGEAAGSQQPEETTPALAAIDGPQVIADGDAVPAAETAGTEALAAAVPAPAAPAKESLESYLGARWAVWAGGLALALGGLFLVRYSIESGLLGPGVRLVLASLFGLALMGAGEAIRRKAMPGIAALYSNAMIPGILTAAGALSLFGAIYAAHGIYGFIGAAAAFTLLALVAFATLGLSLMHGQALAGLGLAGSMVTPLLVSSTSPSPWTLFGFLTLSLVATAAASRLRGWRIVPSLANLGLGGWAFVYVAAASPAELTPVTLALLAMLATSAFIWPAKAFEIIPQAEQPSPGAFLRVLARPPLGMAMTLSFATLLPAIAMLVATLGSDINPFYVMAALTAALAGIGAGRHSMVWPALFAAVGAILGTALQVQIAESLLAMLGNSMDDAVAIPGIAVNVMPVSLGLGAFFVLAGLFFLQRKGNRDPLLATIWAGIMATAPLVIAAISYFGYGDYGRDWAYGLYGIALATALLVSAEMQVRGGRRESLTLAIDLLVAGSFLALAFGLKALTSGLTLTLLLAAAGFAYVLATRLRDWRALPWMMVAASLAVLARIAWEPTIAGPLSLGKTPVFNALLPGYGIPALLAILSAYLLRNWPGVRVRNALQALASLMGLLTVAILVRHAMNGGVLTESVPTLGEQSIYTLLLTGLSGVLMTLDLKSPSPVFRYGSMIAGCIAALNVLFLHLGVLNPYFSGESTGSWPFFNLLLIGYLLPAAAYAGLAYYARDKRPQPYVIMLAVTGSVLAFAWATLSVRRFWQGEFISDWKGFLQGETYSYSVVWLAIGVGLLALGSRFDAKSIRLASAALVLISVAKAFLIDMSHLEGVLRALSFIGLGFVLIGIGLFYQKILSNSRKTEQASHAATPGVGPDPT